MKLQTPTTTLAALVFALSASFAVTAQAADLIIAQNGKTTATIVVSPTAGTWEKRAGEDLQKYIEMMSGAKPAIVAAAGGNGPQLLVGQAALKAEPALQQDLNKVAKKNPTLRADAIAVRRKGNRVLLSGTNDDAHYYAVSYLLEQWGCRWYLPTEFGECIPTQSTLAVGDLNTVYAPPFEVRGYWIAWNGATDGAAEFQHRNMMNNLSVPSGHHPGLADYTKALVPEGKSVLNVPIAEEKTAASVAEQVEPMFAKGEDFSLGMEDGIYESDSALDKELQAGLWDKYFLTPVLTDNFMTLYNSVARRLLQKHPNSDSKIGFLAYSNITIPPQRVLKAEKPLLAYLAPIDIDPNHGMDSPLSPPRHEYKAMMERWADVMDGRVIIYDYDQGMLVWRDIPNPSHYAFAQDVKHYRDAGILGVSTESRNAIATVFLNLFFRGQLMWNPDADMQKMLAEFYPNFYGPAAVPMEKYWSTIYRAWESTLSTEHEYMAAPAIYTPQVVAELRRQLQAAQAAIKPLEAKANPTHNEKLYVERMKFTVLSFGVIENYMAMVHAAASESDYAKAAELGEKALATRMELAKMNPTFTTRVVEVAAETEANGAAWFPGEVKQYRDLGALTNGTKGTLLAKTPLAWAFRRDPNDTGLASGFAYKPADLSYWEQNKAKYSGAGNRWARKDYPTTQWEMLDTDVYAQAQGVLHPDGQSFTGYLWYRTPLKLTAKQVAGKAHLMFPGLFNEAWLYVNGVLVAHREAGKFWWMSDYTFEWDVDVSGQLKAGENLITLRLHDPHHFGGIFRRPFLYQPKG